jgi:hypothetical protein
MQWIDQADAKGSTCRTGGVQAAMSRRAWAMRGQIGAHRKSSIFVTAIMAFPEKIRTGGSAQGAGKSAGLKKVARSRPGARERGSRRDGVTENS